MDDMDKAKRTMDEGKANEKGVQRGFAPLLGEHDTLGCSHGFKNKA